MKQYSDFSEIKECSYFYTKRFPEGRSEADSLRFYKETKEESNCWNPEFGEQTIHSEQQCWFYN